MAKLIFKSDKKEQYIIEHQIFDYQEQIPKNHKIAEKLVVDAILPLLENLSGLGYDCKAFYFFIKAKSPGN